MSREFLKSKKWGRLFLALHLLLLTQIAWWVIVFTKYVDTVHSLRLQLPGGAEMFSQIENEARRQKLMFFSESAFFALIASIALWLLFRALKTEQKSREVQRNFIEVITHESKTPLTALKLRLESIQEKIGAQFSEAEVTRALELALLEVKRLTSIIEKSLEVSRVDKPKLMKEMLELAPLIKNVIQEMEPVILEKNIQVKLRLDDKVKISADSWALKNALQNLIENSLNYNQSPKKEISIELSEINDKAEISIKDNGPGIPEGERELIFEKYFRGKAGRRVPGTGLGLYLTKQIVLAHEGVIKLNPSQQGSHFSIIFPLERGSK